MKFIFILSAFTIPSFYSIGQSLPAFVVSKPIIDSNAINKWVRLGVEPLISNDGKYFSYLAYSGNSGNAVLTVLSTSNSWKITFQGQNFGISTFSADNKRFIFISKDTLYMVLLGAGNVEKIGIVNDCKQPEGSKGNWLAYFTKGKTHELTLLNLITQESRTFTGVIDCYFEHQGRELFLIRSDNNQVLKTYLQWVALPGFKASEIWECDSENEAITGFDTDLGGEQVVFLVKKKVAGEERPTYALWYYKIGTDKAVVKAKDRSAGIEPGLEIGNYKPVFSKSGKYILFQLAERALERRKAGSVSVDVWNYQDTILQYVQLQQTTPRSYAAAISVLGNQVVCLTRDYENIIAYPEKNDQVIVSYKFKGDRFWLKQADSSYLVSLQNGTRVALPSGYKEFVFSPEGKYILYYDLIEQNYYSYNLATGIMINLSNKLASGLLSWKNEFHEGLPAGRPQWPVGIAGWLENDRAVFVYDNYDIWRLEPSGKEKAINLTGGYGYQNRIKFRFTYGMVNNNLPVVFKDTERVLLMAFATESKFNGFYRLSLRKTEQPELLAMGPWSFYLGSRHLLPNSAQNFNYGVGMLPLKAKLNNVWIVSRQTTTDAPNYFLTADFKNYRQLTNIQPQKDYNWLTAELLSWTQPDGTSTQGILYKPENFDSNKKYPVIINYYQQRSHRLYQFPTPEFTGANIDVAWFVSRGYLVFTPDIYFKGKDIDTSAFNTVISATDLLLQYPFVDRKRMGINGHSVGGELTNYIVTHTGIFAAALECAGVSDAISASLQLGDGGSRLESTEERRGDVSIWEDLDFYVRISSVLNAKEVKTPILIMHNKADKAVPWEQAVEFFITLRRLEKPVWMLQYDEGDHVVDGKDAVDFTIRSTQFFDHFLKGSLMPMWMSKGIPARLKGIEMGYELEGSK